MHSLKPKRYGILGVIVFCTPALALAAASQPSFYVGLAAGGSEVTTSNWYRYPNSINGIELLQLRQPDVNPFQVLTYGIAAGYQLQNLPVRAEIAYEHLNNTVFHWNPTWLELNNHQSRGTISSHVIFANLYYDFVNSSAFTPFVGAGIGEAYHHTRFNYYSNSSPPAFTSHGLASYDAHEFAYQLSMGLNYRLMDHWRVGAEVSYMNLGAVKFRETSLNNSPYRIKNMGKANRLSTMTALLNVDYMFG